MIDADFWSFLQYKQGWFFESNEGSSESKDDDFQTSFYTLDTKLKRIKKELSSQTTVVANQIRTLERQIEQKENSMKRSYENRVALIVRAMTHLGETYGEVLTRQAMDSVWTGLGVEDDIPPMEPFSVNEKTQDVIEYFRTYWSEDDQLNPLFDTLLTQTFALPTELLASILTQTKDKTTPFYFLSRILWWRGISGWYRWNICRWWWRLVNNPNLACVS